MRINRDAITDGRVNLKPGHHFDVSHSHDNIIQNWKIINLNLRKHRYDY